MARTGYGRTSSLNRIAYRSTSSRTYRGVKTPRMVADMSTRMAKAQDQVQKDAFDNGQISLDQYTAYLGQRISQTSDPSYRETLTQSLHNLITTDNEKQMTQGYSDGTVTAGQLESYFKSKLNGLDPNSYAYQQTRNDIAKWGTKANTDAYKAQESVLKEQYNGAADKLNSAQKLLDFYVQQTQALTPGTPEYNTAVQNIGTYQSEVRKISFEQQLLKAEDTISQTYAKDTPENWNAKSQMYGQLRDAAAAQGDITNFYKYDQLANTANDNIATSQAKVVSKQVTEAIHQTQADYLSGKIDAQTAQNQMMQISDAALQANDTNGVIIAHDYYNKIESDINHGVSYGGDNGFGKTKGGGGGDTGWFDGTAGTPIGTTSTTATASSGSVSHAGSTSGSVVPNSTKAVSDLKTSTSGASASVNNLDQILNAAKFTNPNATQLSHLSMIQEAGGTAKDMVLYLRTQKVGTGDGWTALQDTYNKDMQEINQKALEGYDPATGQAFTAADAATAIRAEQNAMASLYMTWGNLAAQNPNMKINVDGVNTKIGTLTKTIDEKLNGKVDPQTGLVKKGDEGFLTQISQPLNTQDSILVQDKSNPGAFISTTKAAFESANGVLNKSYVQDSSDPNRYFFINNNDQAQTTDKFNNQQSAQEAANKFNAENKDAISKGIIQAVTPVQNGAEWDVSKPNMQSRTTTVYGPNGQSITYVLDGANNPTSVITSSKGILPDGYVPKTVTSFGGARESIPAGNMGFKLQGQTMTAPTQSNPANTSTQYGPRSTSEPTYANSSTNNQGIGKFNFSGKNGPTYVGTPNTSTRTGNVYTPPPTNSSVDNRTSISGLINPLNKPILSVGGMGIGPTPGQVISPINTLIEKVFGLKPPINIMPSNVLPPSTPFKTYGGDVFSPPTTQQGGQQQQSQNQSPQSQNPASQSAPLTTSGGQQPNNIQKYGQSHPQIPIQGPNIPAQPPKENLFSDVGNIFKGAGNAINSGLNSAAQGISNFFGGFKF